MLIFLICCHIKNFLSFHIHLLLCDDDEQPVQSDQILPSLPPSGPEEKKTEDFQETENEEKYDFSDDV